MFMNCLFTFQLKERSGSMENESDSNSTITPRTIVSAVPLHPPKQDSASTSDSDWPSASPPTPSPSRSRALSQRGSLRGAKPTTPVSLPVTLSLIKIHSQPNLTSPNLTYHQLT